jgi:hypothetical protein
MNSKQVYSIMQPPMHSMSFLTHVPPLLQNLCSERIVLRRYLVREEAVEDRDLLHNVLAYLGHLGEEEEGEEAGYTAESGSEGAAVDVLEGVYGREEIGGRRTTLRLR